MEYINEIKNQKNLLAFSSGTDSSLLFYELNKNNIDFDMIIVNYNIREESKKEVEHAKLLALKYNKKLHLLELETKITSNFEKKARDIRYDFFDKTMEKYKYKNLILGHNLSDKFEWMLMQIAKGAGIEEIYGMNGYTKRKGYNIVRPLIKLTKEEILNKLKKNNIKYFYDKSNSDEKYTRNKIRHNFSEPFLKEFSKGVSKTFDILEKEKEHINKYELIKKKKEYYKYKVDQVFSANILSKHFKKNGYLLSGNQRKEFEKNLEIVIPLNKNKNVIATFKNGYIYITPYITNIKINKKEREKLRLSGIPPKHRPYIYILSQEENIEPSSIF